MSSHHIVRDAQEPAVLLAHLEGWHLAQISGLLEWSPVIAATEYTLPTALQWGIKIDLLVGHPAHRQVLSQQVAHQQPVALHFSEGDQALVALELLMARGHEAVHICSHLAPGPPPESKWQSAAQQCTLVFFGPQWKGYWIAQPFRKWVPQGAIFYLPQAEALHHNGLTAQGNGFYKSTTPGHIALAPAPGQTCWVLEAL